MPLSDDLRDLKAACDRLGDVGTLINDDTPTLTNALGRAWLTRARTRLYERADRWVRGGAALPSTEQAALSIIHGTADELREASRALDRAAVALQRTGGGVHASHAKQAATRALRAAEGLVHA